MPEMLWFIGNVDFDKRNIMRKRCFLITVCSVIFLLLFNLKVQAESVVDKLKREFVFLNPGLQRDDVHFKEEQGELIIVSISARQIKDISPLLKHSSTIKRVSIEPSDQKMVNQIGTFENLEKLYLGVSTAKDLTPLLKLKHLRDLSLRYQYNVRGGADTFAALAKMKLDKFQFHLSQGGGFDLKWLKGLSITHLRLIMGTSFTSDKDLALLKDMHLKELDLDRSLIKDISALKGAEIPKIILNETKITTLEALRGMPLVHLEVNCPDLQSLEPLFGSTTLVKLLIPDHIKPSTLKNMKSLRYIGLSSGGFNKRWISYSQPKPKRPSTLAKKIPEEKKKEKKEVAKGLSKAEITKIKSEIKINFDDIKKALALIETRDGGSGSGFIVKDFDGQHYLYTNQHVIQGVKKFLVRTIGNQKLKPKGFQISDTRDIVRFKLDPESQYPDALEFAKSATNDEPIIVFGNSGGGGVFTSIYGRIVGVGPDRIEVSAEFIPGNSGSPIIDNDGKVVGIATYVTKRNRKGDWTTEGTRFTKVRRFAYRTDPDMKWATMKWKKYQGYAKMIEEDKKYMEDVFKLTVSWLKTPYDSLPVTYKQSELKGWLSTHNRLAKKIQKALAPRYLKRSKKDAINKTAKTYTKKSTKSMSGICCKRAKKIRNRIKNSKKTLTHYLKKEMLENAKILEGMAKEIEKYGGELSARDAVVYRKRGF